MIEAKTIMHCIKSDNGFQKCNNNWYTICIDIMTKAPSCVGKGYTKSLEAEANNIVFSMFYIKTKNERARKKKMALISGSGSIFITIVPPKANRKASC